MLNNGIKNNSLPLLLSSHMELVISDPSSATIASENILWPSDLENTTPVKRKYSHVEAVRIITIAIQ